MVISRKLERARRDVLCCHCPWPRAFTATSTWAPPGRPTVVRIYPLCEIHGMAYATRWGVELPRNPLELGSHPA
jgi:hypothetical protein